jgi:hypothetical protein
MYYGGDEKPYEYQENSRNKRMVAWLPVNAKPRVQQLDKLLVNQG